MALIGHSGPSEKLICEKNQKLKISWQTSFRSSCVVGVIASSDVTESVWYWSFKEQAGPLQLYKKNNREKYPGTGPLTVNSVYVAWVFLRIKRGRLIRRCGRDTVRQQQWGDIFDHVWGSGHAGGDAYAGSDCLGNTGFLMFIPPPSKCTKNYSGTFITCL
jgi:hypothetical protein